MKLVINKCYGGYGLSPEAVLWLNQRGFDGPEFRCSVEEYYGLNKNSPRTTESYKNDLKEWRKFLKLNPDGKIKGKREIPVMLTVFTPDEKFVLSTRVEPRNHPLLVQVVQELGERANSWASELRVVEIPDDVEWELDEYDGIESVHETHRSWG